MDDDPSLFAGLPTFTSPHATTELEIYIAPTAEKEKNLVRLALVPVGCWRCNEQNFAFDSSFVDATFTVGKLPELLKANPGALATLFGHADPVGDDAYNHFLSGRRAKAMYALLTRKHALWHDLYEQPYGGDAWGERSTQTILSALVDPSDPAGGTYYSGPIDGRLTADYLKALHKFQSDNGVTPVRNTADHATREKLYPAYMAKLCGDFQMTADQFLGKGTDPKGKMDFQGCSEFNPVLLLAAAEENSGSKERDDDNAPNRRVVMFLFRDDVDVKPSDWPCPTLAEGHGKCYGQFWPQGVGDARRHIKKDKQEYAKTGDTMGCRFYDRFARRSPCEGRPVVLHAANTIAITADAPQFAPLTEKLIVSWEITGPIQHVWALRLVVATKAAPDKSLVEQLIEGPYDAKGSFAWDGSVTDESFDKCVSVKSSPYVLKIVMETKEGARKTLSNVVEVAVVLQDFDIRLEDVPSARTPAANTAALAALKSDLETKGRVGSLVLDSPVFPRAEPHELTTDAAFKRYKAFWGDGILVPLVARVWLKGKKGDKQRSPHALAGIRVLWDVFMDGDAAYSSAIDARGVTPTAKAFIEKVSTYKENDSKPKGRTAHQYFGGQRSDKPAYFRFLYPWNDEHPEQRTFAQYTSVDEASGVDADTGVFFLPGRMATDRHFVRAFVDDDGSLDTLDDKKLDAVPPSRRAATMEITVEKRIFVHRIFKYGADAVISFPALQAQYKKCGMIIEKSPVFQEIDITAAWKIAYKRAVADLGKNDAFVKDAAMDDNGDLPAQFISWEDFWEKTHPDASLPEILLHRLGALFGSKEEDAYNQQCDDAAGKLIQIAGTAFKPFLDKGISIFVWKTGVQQNRGSHVGGFSGPFPGFYGDTNMAYYTFRLDDAGVAHEMGHTLFLAHQSGTADADNPPKDADDQAHDKHMDCIMSYRGGVQNLCGLCILKLAGWDNRGSKHGITKIDSDGNVT